MIMPRLPRRWALVGLVSVAGLLALAGQPLWSAVAAALLVTAIVVPHASDPSRAAMDLLGWLPVGFVLLVSAVSIAAVSAGFVGIPLWTEGRGRITWIAMLVLICAVGLARGGRVALWSARSGLAWLPAVAFAVVAAYRYSQPMSFWSRPIWQLTDWMNHAEMLADLRAKGFLDYRLPTPASVDIPVIYPRGLHALAAWLLDVMTSSGSLMESWERILLALSLAGTVATVLAIASASMLAIVTAHRLRAPTWVVVVASLASAAAFLYPNWYTVFVWSGFVTTGAVAVALFSLVQVADAGRRESGSPLRLVVVLAMVASVFNLWQLMAVPFLLVAGFLAVIWWRSGRSHAPWVIGVALVSAAACIPLTVETVSGVGLSQSRVAGEFISFSPAVTLVVCALPVGFLVFLRRPPVGDGLRIAFPIAVVSTALIGLGLIAYSGGSLDSLPYYAGKVLWHAVVLACPVFLAVLGYLVVRAWSSRWLAVASRQIGALRLLILGVPLALAIAVVGGSASYQMSTTLSLMTSAGGQSPQVPLIVLDSSVDLGPPGTPVLVWGLHPQGWHLWLRWADWHASQVVRAEGHPVPGSAVLVGHRAIEACAWLSEHPDAVRLTGPRRGQDELLRRGCPADVVKPSAWQVLRTPDEWWRGTEWEKYGGSPDPGIEDTDPELEQWADKASAERKVIAPSGFTSR